MAIMAFETELTPTPLLDLPELAGKMEIGRLFAKDEGQRPLGNFKFLGGMHAGLRALDRCPGKPPRLICASDGNHGLAVAAAAQSAGAEARIYLPADASIQRAARIEALGGTIVWVRGTYDDAVEAAANAAADGEGILVADTTATPNDPVVDDVMSGYGRICLEMIDQLPERPTHLFVQAGVGGFAAAMADGLKDSMAAPGRIIVVEPEAAACVEAALRAGWPVRIEGNLHTCAEMLSCGLASAPALEILLDHGVDSLVVSEAVLMEAVSSLVAAGGPPTTPSGAAGLAGLLYAAANQKCRSDLELVSDSRVLIVVTEKCLNDTSS